MMQKVPFIFRELSIDKMPGFPRGMKTYENFSPNINIIAGPNASGKSSTARVIRELIWRKKVNHTQAEAFADIGGENWKIRMDFGNIETQRNGQNDTLAGLPATETESRYMLALHELVRAEEKELASHIVRESIGGYNLDAAESELGYSYQARSSTISEHKAYQEAEGHFKDIQQRQWDLKKEEDRLQKLYKDRDDAREASRLKDFYERVIEYLEAEQELEQQRKIYEEYPKVMEKVNGSEYDRIQDLEEEMGKAEQGIREAQNKTIQLKNELAELNLPEGGVSDAILDELEQRIASLEENRREIREENKQFEYYQTETKQALKAIDESIDPNQWEGVDLKNVRNLEDFLLRAHQTISRHQFLETEIDELKKALDDSSHQFESEALQHGIKTLGLWLQSQRRQKGTSKKWVIILSATGAILTVLTYFAGWPALFGIILLPILSYFALKERPIEEISMREKDYQLTGLPLPESWNVDKVNETINYLISELHTIKWMEMIRQKLDNLSKEREAANKQLEEIKETYDQWVRKLQAAPHLPEKDPRNYSGLYTFVMNLNTWQQAHAELEALRSQLENLSQNHDQILKKINARFQEHFVEKAKDATEARALYNELKKEEERRRENTREIKRQEETIKEKQQQIDSDKKKLREIYEKLNVDYGDKERVRQLVEQLDKYREARENFQFSERKLSEKKERVREHSLYEQHQKELTGLTPDQAREKAGRYGEEAEKLENINEKITTIETNISNAKQGNALEDALQKKQKALDDLESLYESNLAAFTGKLLVGRLKQETKEQNRPAVFMRAKELFNRITSGRYELMLDEQNEATFRAMDTVLREGQDLSELSTGTQIQLLLSVRLAYIESQETAVKLPILADELLANSDDARARAIIDALVEISRDGRQIFYFTAQSDEVAKWESYLTSLNDISYKTIPLTGKQNESVDLRSQPDLASFKIEQFNVPSPEGKSHDEYGKALGVPAFNLLTDEITQIHLWYLLEDSQLLHNCLKNGLQYWGQLDSYLRNGGHLEGMEDRQINKLRDKIKLLNRFQELYRQGRPQPIDRSVLEQSGAVSEKFIDAVSEQLNMLNGNPEKLIQSLKYGKVQGFRKNKIEELEQFLLEYGYIDEQPRLNEEDIWINLKALISNMDIETTEAERFINRILNI
ncbi:MAG: hypothetical protein ACQER7_04980 [Bacteroidota bacterium]